MVNAVDCGTVVPDRGIVEVLNLRDNLKSLRQSINLWHNISLASILTALLS